MKSIITTILITFAIALPAFSQVVGFGSGQTVTGTTNSPAVDTNTPSIPIRNINLTINAPSGTTITGFTGNVYLSLSPTSVTGGLLVGTWTGTNFSTTNVQFTSFFTNARVFTVLQAINGTNQPSLQELYGP